MPLIYLKMEGEIGHALLPPLGTHLSWLLWGRSRSASFLRGHQNVGRRADTPSLPPVYIRFGLCMAVCGASVRYRGKPQKRLYLGLDGPNRDSEGTLPQGDPPLLVVSTPWSWSWSWSCLCSTHFYAQVCLHCDTRTGHSIFARPQSVPHLTSLT